MLNSQENSELRFPQQLGLCPPVHYNRGFGAIIQDTGQPQLLFSNACKQRRSSWTTERADSEEPPRHHPRNQECRSQEHPGGADPAARAAEGAERLCCCSSGRFRVGRRIFPFPRGRGAAPLQLGTCWSREPSGAVPSGSGKNLPVDQKAVQARSRRCRQLRSR